MIRKFTLDIVSPEALVLSKEVVMVQAPGVEGEFGVLNSHAPMIAALQAGELKVNEFDDRDSKTITISGGFLEVANNRCTILAEKIVNV
jgi:F-type H+-transporting ATPase subunit epsilon